MSVVAPGGLIAGWIRVEVADVQAGKCVTRVAHWLNCSAMATVTVSRQALALLTRGYCFARYLRRKFLEDRCGETVSALTYQTMFAVVPLLTVAYLLINAVPALAGVERQVEDFIFTNIVPENMSVIRLHLSDFSADPRCRRGLRAGPGSF